MVACLFLSGCSLPQVTAELRIFLDLELEFVGDYQLPQATVDGTTMGGLSGIAYDRQRDRIYALSDDRQKPRFYTLALNINAADQLEKITVEEVTLLKDEQGQPIASKVLDPEGIALTPQGQLWISSEGVQPQSPPIVAAFALNTATWQEQLKLPSYFSPAPEADAPPQGISDNRGFEALTLNPEGDRIFTATELPLIQDFDPDASDPERYSRLLHYLVRDVRPLLISEYLYPLAPPTLGLNGLTELLSIDSGGHFLTLERSYSPLSGFNAQLFQIATAGATDTSRLERLETPLQGVNPILKKPLINLRDLNLTLGNLEGMTLGPTLSDGSRSLLLVSDNGFDAEQPTQFLLFRLR
ncbi:MAG: esterase-like activity of phytase family protein [Thermosynechococcaceae cyanobacterium]